MSSRLSYVLSTRPDGATWQDSKTQSQKSKHKAGKMPHRVEALATKPDDLKWTPSNPTWWKEKTDSPKVS